MKGVTKVETRSLDYRSHRPRSRDEEGLRA